MLTKEEYTELKYREKRIELGGMDGADIEEYQEYARQLEQEYNKDIKQLEADYINQLATGHV